MAIFQRTIENIVYGLPPTEVHVDDILVTGTEGANHLYNVERVLQRLEESGFKGKKVKCHVFFPKVFHMGYHLLTNTGIVRTLKKTKVVLEAKSQRMCLS